MRAVAADKDALSQAQHASCELVTGFVCSVHRLKRCSSCRRRRGSEPRFFRFVRDSRVHPPNLSVALRLFCAQHKAAVNVVHQALCAQSRLRMATRSTVFIAGIEACREQQLLQGSHELNTTSSPRPMSVTSSNSRMTRPPLRLLRHCLRAIMPSQGEGGTNTPRAWLGH